MNFSSVLFFIFITSNFYAQSVLDGDVFGKIRRFYQYENTFGVDSLGVDFVDTTHKILTDQVTFDDRGNPIEVLQMNYGDTLKILSKYTINNKILESISYENDGTSSKIENKYSNKNILYEQSQTNYFKLENKGVVALKKYNLAGQLTVEYEAILNAGGYSTGQMIITKQYIYNQNGKIYKQLKPAYRGEGASMVAEKEYIYGETGNLQYVKYIGELSFQDYGNIVEEYNSTGKIIKKTWNNIRDFDKAKSIYDKLIAEKIKLGFTDIKPFIYNAVSVSYYDYDTNNVLIKQWKIDEVTGEKITEKVYQYTFDSSHNCTNFTTIDSSGSFSEIKEFDSNNNWIKLYTKDNNSNEEGGVIYRMFEYF